MRQQVYDKLFYAPLERRIERNLYWFRWIKSYRQLQTIPFIIAMVLQNIIHVSITIV